MSSAALVNQLRRHFQAQKAGHGGTLDPDATGLLPIAFGEATKLLPFMEDRLKTYEFTAIWGAATTSDDAAGEVLKKSDKRPARDEVEALLPQFEGMIEQIPPKISARKLDGARAYALAREGKEFELKAKPLYVKELRLLEFTREMARFRLICARGGYVRSIARDLGEKLGSLAHVGELRRLASLGFDIEMASPLDALERHESIATAPLLPIAATPGFVCISLDGAQAARLSQGQSVMIKPQAEAQGEIAIAIHDKTPIAIVERAENALISKRGFRA